MAPLQRKPVTEAEALERLEAACSRAEKCSHELRESMRHWGLSPAATDRVLDTLRRGRYYDDARYASIFARQKIEFDRWGRQKVRAALRQRGIDSEAINAALAEAVPDEEAYYRSLVAVLRPRALRLQPDPATPLTRLEVASLARFAAGRGFESSLIWSALRDPLLRRT